MKINFENFAGRLRIWKIFLLSITLIICIDYFNLVELRFSAKFPLKTDKLTQISSTKFSYDSIISDLRLQNIDQDHNVVYLGFDIIQANEIGQKYIFLATTSNFLWDVDLKKLKYSMKKSSSSDKVKRATELLNDFFYLLKITNFTKGRHNILLAPPTKYIPECWSLFDEISTTSKKRLISYLKSFIKQNYSVKDYNEISKYLTKKTDHFCQISYLLTIEKLETFPNVFFEKVLLEDKYKLIKTKTEQNYTWSYISDKVSKPILVKLLKISKKRDFFTDDDFEVDILELLKSKQKHTCSKRFNMLPCCISVSVLEDLELKTQNIDWKILLQTNNTSLEQKQRLTDSESYIFDILTIEKNNTFSEVKEYTEILKTESKDQWLCLPNIILIGAQKGATGEIAQWLSKNKRIHRLKGEVHFFDNLSPFIVEKASKNHIERLESYLHVFDNSNFTLKPFKIKHRIYTPITLHKVEIEEKYTETELKAKYLTKLMNSKLPTPFLKTSHFFENKLIFEKTPAYFDKAQPKHLYDSGVNEILLILRDPVKRLHSAFWHGCRRFKERKCNKFEFRNWVLTSFKNLNELNTNKNIVFDLQGIRAIAYGLYDSYLSSWITEAENRNLKLTVMFTESFQNDPFLLMKELEETLGLNNIDYKTTAKSVNGRWTVSKSSKAITEEKPSGYATLNEDPSMKSFLYDFYQPSINKLKILLAEKKDFLNILGKVPNWLL